MPHNVFIAGAPGIGKTTLITRLHHDLTPLVIRGFHKEAIYENRTLKGYRLSTFNFDDLILAHMHIEGPDHIAGFGLNLDGFDALVARQLAIHKNVELILLDEIGVMECTSAFFRQKIREVLKSDIPLIATLASVEILDELKIKDSKDYALLSMTLKNRDSLWKTVMLEISKT